MNPADDPRDMGALVDELATVRNRIAQSWALDLPQSELQALHDRESELAKLLKVRVRPGLHPAPSVRCWCEAHPMPHYHEPTTGGVHQ